MEIGQIPEEVNAGDRLQIPVQLVNVGRGMVYNARCTVDVPGLQTDKSLFLGNIEGGTAVSSELDAFAGVVNAEEETTEKRYGRTGGRILLTYEDEDGNSYEETSDIVLTIQPLKIEEKNTDKKGKIKMKRKQNIRWNTMKILVIGFLSVIVLGAVLLWLPVSNEKPISFLDALFTSTTSVCVTGLVTVVPKYQFTIMGKIILLILIQIGGLGIIACITAFFMLLKRKITVKERIVIQEAYNMNSLGGLVGMVRRILFGTVVVEGIGAVFYAIQFSRDYGLVKGIWYGVFHSVSAFCNAGIDILGEDSLARYVTSPLINITTMMLIILGGIGFTVWYDVIDNGKKIWHREIPKKWCFTRLKLHSKIAIVTTLILLIAGTLLNFVLEYQNPETIGNLNTGQKIMASAFQAVTTRTAGFSTFQQSGMHEETGFLNIILMFIGGSPGGTAGGLKTTTFALLFLAFHTMLRGGHDIECFQRKVAEDSFRVAFVTFMLALGIYVTGTTVIAVIEPDTISLQKIMYETASAMATVGLTQDLTTHLRVGSKIVLMILMYAGRVGPMTIALLFAGKVNLQEKMRTLPTEKIMIG